MQINLNNDKPYYQLGSKIKNISLILIITGLLGVVFGFFLGESEKVFANLLMMSYYFVAVCLAGTVFLGIQYLARAGWSTAILRIPHAFASVLPISGAILIIVILLGLFTHNLYHHWADPELVNPNSEHFDKIIFGKKAYLNTPFFILRVVLLTAIYTFCAYLFVKYSVREDIEGGVKLYKKSFVLSAIFIVFFAFTYPLFSFDAIMSLEAHWYSTMFGWYNFAGLWVSGLSLMAIVLVGLKERGYFEWVTENHLHDLGKFIFGFSIFWTYLWFCQFLLIYYANLPEETSYFYKRLESPYRPLFFINFILCFISPFLLFMTRDSKRKFKYVKWVCALILIGHYIDYYLMFMPGTVYKDASFSYIEVSAIFLFVGLFIFTVFNSLTRRVLVPSNHPLLEESLHHHQ